MTSVGAGGGELCGRWDGWCDGGWAGGATGAEAGDWESVLVQWRKKRRSENEKIDCCILWVVVG